MPDMGPEGDAFRNTIERRYLDSVEYVKNAGAESERRKLAAVIAIFRKYATSTTSITC